MHQYGTELHVNKSVLITLRGNSTTLRLSRNSTFCRRIGENNTTHSLNNTSVVHLLSEPKLAVMWSWKMHESNRGPSVSTDSLCLYWHLSPLCWICARATIPGSEWTERSTLTCTHMTLISIGCMARLSCVSPRVSAVNLSELLLYIPLWEGHGRCWLLQGVKLQGVGSSLFKCWWTIQALTLSLLQIFLFSGILYIL